MNRPPLTGYAWLSIAAAIVTIGLKSFAYRITGSVGLLSDAVESLVNLVGAGFALAMLTIAARPPDDDHLYGHCKAEYFSSGLEGILILAAAISIGAAAVGRLIHPKPLVEAFEGLIVCAIASLINFEMARILMYVGKKHNSITLEADAHHLMTDVWTSAAVIAGVSAVALTGWEPLDPIVALMVAANITWSGFQLIRRSVAGLMDAALPVEECGIVVKILEEYIRQGIEFHAFRTRQSGARRFISLHVLVPGTWTVIEGHRLVEQIETDIRSRLSNVTMFTHLEPLDDPSSLQDIGLDR